MVLGLGSTSVAISSYMENSTEGTLNFVVSGPRRGLGGTRENWEEFGNKECRRRESEVK